jgi:hypothetical protein
VPGGASFDGVIVVALVALCALPIALLARLRVGSRPAEEVPPLDPGRVEDEVYARLYGRRPRNVSAPDLTEPAAEVIEFRRRAVGTAGSSARRRSARR